MCNMGGTRRVQFKQAGFLGHKWELSKALGTFYSYEELLREIATLTNAANRRIEAPKSQENSVALKPCNWFLIIGYIRVAFA